MRVSSFGAVTVPATIGLTGTSPNAAPRGDYRGPRVRWIDSLDELESLQDEWNDLANNALVRNPFFEPNFLLPGIRHLSNGSVRVLVVEQVLVGQESPSLCAIVPIVKKRVYQLPFRACEVWRNEQSLNATPLLRRGKAKETWQAVVEFLDREGFSLLSLDTVSAEDNFQVVVDSAIGSRGTECFIRDRFERAAYVADQSSEDYVRRHSSKGLQKKNRKYRRTLSEQGAIAFHLANRDSDYDSLAEQFLAIESSGWKKENGTALACHETTEAFYRELIMRSANCGKAHFLTLMLDDRPIAMLSDFVSGDSAICYKTAYDEEFASHAPGVQIEFGNLEVFHQLGVKYADSCTAPDNELLNRMWGQRAKFQSLVLSLRPGLASWVSRGLPLMQSAVRKIKCR